MKVRQLRMTILAVATSLFDPTQTYFFAVRDEQGSKIMSPSQARNSIKRALKAVIDPVAKAKEKNAVWLFFQNRCAYCDCEIERDSRTGHIDHLIAEADGGSNRLSNLVLTCAVCNGDEKREMDWEEFIAEKCGADERARAARVATIKEWVRKNGGTPRLSEYQVSSLQVHYDRINSVLSDAIDELRLERD